MAYKFQTLAATMSGSLTQEGDFTVKNDAGVTGFSATAAGAVSGSGALSAGGALRTRGTVRLDGVVAAGVAIAADSLYIFDATDNLVKTESVSNFATAIAGPGIAAVGGALEVNLDEFAALGATPHATQDSYLISDNGTEKTITVTHAANGAFALVSGDATIAAGGALTIAAQAVENSMLADDAVGADELAANAVVEASIVDNAVTLAKMAGLARGKFIYGDASGDPAALAVGSAHQFLQADGTDLAWVSMSGDVTLAAGVATIQAGAVETAMLNNNVISGQTELAQGSLAAADEILISDGGTIKKFGVDSLAKDALALTTEAAIANGDYIMFLDGGATGETKKESLADLATLFAGDGLSAGSSALAVAVSGAVHVSSDKVALSGSVAGTGLTYTGGVDSILTLALDIDELAALGGTGVAQGDHFLFSDGGTEKKITASNLEDWMFGNVSGDATIAAGGALTIAADAVEPSMMNIFDDSLAATTTHFMIADGTDYSSFALSGDVTCTNADGGALTIAANAVQTGMVHDDVATELAGNGLSAASGVMALDLNELSAATVAVAADSIAIIDADDSNNPKKESIADFVAAMAGAGLSAASGQLSVTGNNVAIKADSEALVEGYNYFADASSNATVTLPAGPAVGDVVTAKAGNLTSNAIITINKGSADHRIDGLEGIILESPFASVTMVYVVADHWKIV